MRSRQYVAIEPLHEMPAGPWVPYNDRADALADALRDVELGGYDQLIMGWLVRHLDNPTMRTLVSLIERVRGAGLLAAVELEAALQERNAQRKREEAYGGR
jgi:hypothetical protein